MLEVSRARSAQNGAESQIPEIERQIVLKENQLSVLLARLPGPIERTRDLRRPAIAAAIPVHRGYPAGEYGRTAAPAQESVVFRNATVWTNTDRGVLELRVACRIEPHMYELFDTAATLRAPPQPPPTLHDGARQRGRPGARVRCGRPVARSRSALGQQFLVQFPASDASRVLSSAWWST